MFSLGKMIVTCCCTILEGGDNDGNFYLTSEKFRGSCNCPVALCSVSVIAANKVSLQEINQSMDIELLTSGFLENFGV